MKRSRRRSAADIEALAARWILRRDAGLTAEEELEFNQWVSSDPDHAAAMARRIAVWRQLDRPGRAGQADVMLARLALRAAVRRRRRVTLAATAVLLIGLTLLLPRWSRDGDLAVAGQGIVVKPEKRILPDGSAVELIPGAEISVEYKGQVRQVRLLAGQAHFQVAPNKERPFVVLAGTVGFRAVGTIFSVELREDLVDLLVTEGAVAVERPETSVERLAAPAAEPSRAFSQTLPEPGALQPLVTITAGSRLVLDRIGGSSAGVPPAMVLSPTEIAERLAWRAPKLEFSELPLREAVALMNQYNRDQFVIEDTRLGRVPISGVFRAGNTETFLRLLEVTCDIEATRSESTTILRRRR